MTDDDINQLKGDIHQLNKAVFLGNGQKPLTSRMEKNEVEIDQLKQQLAKIQQSNAWLLRLCVSQLVTILAGYVPKILALLN